MSKVYTRTGDRGKTSLYTGERVSKDSLRVEAYGSVDEADSVLGQARAFAVHENVKSTIYKLQKDLWMLMADVASVGNEPNIKPEDVTELERLIDSYTESLQPLDHFLVPGETKSESFLNAARSVVRRAERAMWRLNESEPVNEVDIRYLNRLSDLCFTLGRYESEVK
ncbi:MULTISPECIES: cob(I)yrinic acid a,c-diamide adenosyltransferase [Dialister]|jgi:cob(I)alamin adenosyltransferase|uniref:Corrinoid adenosyltransferase n=1 Tax=Dialister hominis TaxID=2582419 RepID=A0A8E4BQT2_9FIRM|nr:MULTISPECIES: cob(I)yrinic acid a,c-diamide adenosyltransferase [Dialister]HJI42783.1 cob(I)yrinic acid a,c-diamide adenosyltransferase [Veillonellaceae bacterium]MBS6412498.1 cob(I)yrinic acid a,c-diamide adenosyltransferase [Dialister sp.]MCH3912347.1 cob(I)yrinic acid a,c-diamide adenosyltransferase [Dialister sp.]MCH3929897.1 cob(I)yrinic acid a,c-diamide adenosyltransferase [Dialister sp.]MEE1349704.1 cob(I)yrinic acid a,c-diamide adenosyltransferase [Dialister hominis]